MGTGLNPHARRLHDHGWRGLRRGRRVLAGGGGGAADVIELDASLLVDSVGRRPNVPSVGPLRRRPANIEAAFRARAFCLEPATDACFMEGMLARQPDQ